MKLSDTRARQLFSSRASSGYAHSRLALKYARLKVYPRSTVTQTHVFQSYCPSVDGCAAPSSSPQSSLVQNFRRYKRQNLAFPQIPLLGNTPGQFLRGYQGQVRLPGPLLAPTARPPAALQQYLLALAGDHIVSKKLIVVNSENELGYYLRTGSVPNSNAALYGKKRKRK